MRLRDCVRVDISTVMASIAVSPRLPALLQLHPLLEIELITTQRRVAIVSVGFDCVVRAGDDGLAQCGGDGIGRVLLTQ